MQHLQKLCQRLNYEFKNIKHLKQALTHRSAGSSNYERYEFLGDSILSAVIAHTLFNQFPHRSEGELSRLRAHLVKGDMLAQIAATCQLGDYLYLGQGELKSGGFRRASILADALEAIFAAIYLDSGFEAAEQVILHLYGPYLNHDELNSNLKDYKTQLQEWLQAKKSPLPTYTLTKVEGEEHDQTFYVSCAVPHFKLTAHGQAETRRKAEQLAAKTLLTQLLKKNPSPVR